ncbi:glycosyltransferase [Cellvibrio mixtus]|nr:glycosyltransferase [Cellvibrio mixtus]
MINEHHLSLLQTTQYFDEQWYSHRYKDVEKLGISAAEHYLRIGYLLGRDPSLKFSTNFYLKAHPDVAVAQINPLIHYLEYGINEARIIAQVKVMQNIKASLRNTKYKSPARVAIYTALIGGHDVLVEPECVPQHCDFFVFSDSDISSKIWKQKPINYHCNDRVKTARFIKLHPHLFFPDYEYSIWIDANIELTKDLTHLLDGLDGKLAVASFPHPYRSCIYEEGISCIGMKKDNPHTIQSQLQRYQSLGIPENLGLWETCILARRHNEQNSVDLMTAWWSEIQLYSRRDQISLPAVSFINNIKIKSLAPSGADLRMYPGIIFRQHNHLTNKSEQDTRQSISILWRDVDPKIIPVDIVICVHNALEETRECLSSVINSIRGLDKLIIVNDASNRETTLFLQEFANNHLHVELISNQENMGYTKSANIGLECSTNPYIMLLNSDTRICSNVIDKMLVLAEQNKNIGIVGPLSNAATWQSIPYLPDANNYSKNNLPENLKIEQINAFLEDNFTGETPYVDLVNGFCYLIKRDVINKIGNLDEGSFPTGYGEEDDYSIRARKSGFILAIATNTYVYHHKSKSFTPERRSILAQAGQEALIKKHGKNQIIASVKTVSEHPELVIVRNVASSWLKSYIQHTSE